MKGNRGMRSRETAAQMHALVAVRRDMRKRDSAHGRKYVREFTEAFRNYDSVLPQRDLDAKIASATTILVGDYHALAASQRFAVELIEKVAHTRRIVLGIEAVLSRDQSTLDTWWRRELCENELREKLRFDREWGYEWAPFYALLSAARDHAEAIYALDCQPRNDLRRIRTRDRHAAAKIAQIRQQHPDTVILVLFGESHLAPQHLPRQLKLAMPQERALNILQNVDALYWQAVSDHSGAAAVALGSETVCVFNSTPLEKYESYRICFERWNTSVDDVPDFTPAIYNLIFSLATSLGFRLDSPRNGTQPRFLCDSLPEVVGVEDDTAGGLSPEDALKLEDRGCVYVAKTNTFFVSEFKVADAASEAARFLYHACQGFRTFAHGKRVEDAMASFGATLLCPSLGNSNSGTCEAGQFLYQSYVAGRLGKAAIRRLFLTHIESGEAAERLLCTIGTASDNGVGLPITT
jgi:uncharacterized iron-regulated protein